MTFLNDYSQLAYALLRTQPFSRGKWQSLDVSSSRAHDTFELTNVMLDYVIPDSQVDLRLETDPNMPWAEKHFHERVGGKPLNPPPSHVEWPWARHNARFQLGPEQQFSHTYPERLWPRYAGRPGHELMMSELGREAVTNRGIRYRYGDLDDVVLQLIHDRMTRQAFVPIWFPEDTGAVQGQRVPCTIGYHLMVVNGLLDCWYPMRSCDLLRHFKDDVYLAGRLTQWMCWMVTSGINDDDHYGQLRPGTLHMTISSLHAFRGDRRQLESIAGSMHT